MSELPIKQGRNEPCFCGSGRKFKHCHGGLPGVAAAGAASTAAHWAAPMPANSQRPASAAVEVLNPHEIAWLVGLIEQGRLAEAERAAGAALTSHPEAGIFWKILSVAQVRQGKDALAALRRAAQLLPDDTEALRNLGAALHDRKLWAEALESLRRVLTVQPDDIESLVDAANSLRGLGRARDSVELYERALRLDPKRVEARNNLGNAFLELKDFTRARDCYTQALQLKPLDAQIIGNLAAAHRHMGQPEEAAAFARQAVGLEPGSSEAHNSLGLALAALGRREEAVASYRQALQLDPRSVDAHTNLGNVLRDLGDRRGALESLRQAVELDPTRAESHCNLGNVLFEMRQVERALACHRQALALQPRYAPAHLSVAFALRQKRLAAEAEASCQAALAIDPDYVEALSFLGELRADAGRFAEAEKLFQRVIELDPNFSFAVASIATHRRMTREDSQWLRSAQSLLAKRLPVGHEISLRYSLGKYYDDIGEYDPAFEQYRLANELTKRSGVRYNRAALRQRLDQIMATFDASLIRECQTTASGSEVPVLIVGMPRSGTSLTEQILASHPAVFGAGEVSFWNAAYDSYRDAAPDAPPPPKRVAAMAERYLEQLQALGGNAERIIDKMPANFMYGGLIHAAFPRARIIHMKRHPLDTCLSIYFQHFFNIGPYASDLDDLAHFYGEYVRITDHWRATLPPGAWLDVPYEELIADPESWTRRMLQFIDLPWDARCLEFHRTDRVVITASRWQVRQKIHSSSAGRWRHYEKYLGPLRHLVRD